MALSKDYFDPLEHKESIMVYVKIFSYNVIYILNFILKFNLQTLSAYFFVKLSGELSEFLGHFGPQDNLVSKKTNIWKIHNTYRFELLNILIQYSTNKVVLPYILSKKVV